MNTLSFMTANFVARQIDYNMTGGWGHGDKATNAYFKPLDTFAPRFEAMLSEIKGMGFEAIDLWLSHLNYTWATPEHIAAARELLDQYGLSVISLAGGFGSTPEEFVQTCRMANALECRILGGAAPMLAKDRDFVVATLQAHDLLLGLENHPEKNPGEVLAKIGDGGDGRIGACVDTAWFAIQGYDPARALRELDGHLIHVHLKDALAPTAEHEHNSCAFGDGIVPVEECVRTLQELGYTGGLSIEHEPDFYDPTDDCIAARLMVETWLAG